ncbi:hypothetical protein N9Y89_00675 [bacterium]|nr:hypothetical protein [bacterium]
MNGSSLVLGAIFFTFQIYGDFSVINGRYEQALVLVHGGFIQLHEIQDFKRAFVGIHPQFKHTPPKDSFSTIAVFNPNCEARMASVRTISFPCQVVPIPTFPFPLIVIRVGVPFPSLWN